MTLSEVAEAGAADLAALGYEGRARAPSKPRAPARSLEEWLEDPELLRVPRLVVPQLALEGRVSLLSGREKIGKSTLVGCAVAHLTNGTPFLGASCDPASVLWYAVDEPVGDTCRRLAAHGAYRKRVIITDEPRNLSELLERLEDDVRANPGVQLIVVDTLSRLFAGSGIDTNDASSVEGPMFQIVDRFHSLNLAALLIYHTGKAGREYRGSTAIGAAVDEILTLRRKTTASHEKSDEDEDDLPDDGRRRLVQNGRHFRDLVHLTCAEGRYDLLDAAQPVRQRILDALKSSEPPSSRSELAKLAGGRRQTALEEIAAMIREGKILEDHNRRLTARFPNATEQAA